MADKGKQVAAAFVCYFRSPFSAFPHPSRKKGNQGEKDDLVCTEGEAITAFLYFYIPIPILFLYAITIPSTPRYPQTLENAFFFACPL